MLKFLLQKLKTLKFLLPYLPIPIIILVAILLISIANPPPVEIVRVWDGDPDLRGHNFENYVVHLRGHCGVRPQCFAIPNRI